MKKILFAFSAVLLTTVCYSQSCSFDRQISTADSVLCAGDSTTLSFPGSVALSDTSVATPIVNNNGQDGNMFNITATNTIRITYFEGNIANTPSVTTDYYVYYKVGTHVGFENNAAAWTLIAGPVSFNPNAPNTLTTIPIAVNVVIPAGQTYAFYLTNTSAISNNNRYHNGTATGNVLSTNPDLTVYEGTGGAYPFGTFFNARPWEGKVHYDFPPPTYLWNTGATTSTITVQPGVTTPYSCIATYGAIGCNVEDSINIMVNALPMPAFGSDTAICMGDILTLDAGNPGSAYAWCGGDTTQMISVTVAGAYCVAVTDINGCIGRDTISLTVNNLPVIAAIGDTICAGSPGTMFASGSATLYNWSPGALSGNVVSDSPPSTTTYTITGTDGNGCSSTTTAEMVVNALPVITFSFLGMLCLDDNSVALTGSAMPVGGMYSGPGVSADTLFPAVAGAGTYMITYLYTDSLGCMNSDSTSVTIDLCLGLVSNNSNGGVSVYPNPMHESAVVSIGDGVVAEHAQFTLYDVSGKAVMQVDEISSNTVVIDRSALANGVYFYNVVNNGVVVGSGKLIVE